LVAFPINCAFNEWKEQNEMTALTLHALVDIIGFYKQKLTEFLND
jgi:hypothetical protein